MPRGSNTANGRTHCHQALLPGQGCMVASEGESCTSGPGSCLVLWSDHLTRCLGWLGIKPLLQQEPFAEATRIFHQWSICLRARCPTRVCEPKDAKVASGKLNAGCCPCCSACGQGAELGHWHSGCAGGRCWDGAGCCTTGGASWEL